jgi:type II secretory pathway pseudopilin PulG
MSFLSPKLRQRLADEDGFTLVEVMVAAGLGLILLIAVGSFLMSAMRASIFAETQSRTLDDARTVMKQIEKETRGAEFITWCADDGSCLEVGAQSPTGTAKTVRYTHADAQLLRAEFDSVDNEWSAQEVSVERLANSSSQPVFSCDEQSTLLRLNVDLHIEPTPTSGPNLQITTSIRPRNYASIANQCPEATP